MHEYNSGTGSVDIIDEALFDHPLQDAHAADCHDYFGAGSRSVFGMPEMAVPSFRIDYHGYLSQLVSLDYRRTVFGHKFRRFGGTCDARSDSGRQAFCIYKLGIYCICNFAPGRLDSD